MWAELTKVYHWLDGGEGAATIVVATIALVGAIAGVITSYIVAGRSVYINSITAERSKWIDKLRVNIAAYSGSLAATVFKVHTAEVGQTSDNERGILTVREELEALNKVAATIQLQLNPWGDVDRNILKIIEAIIIRKTTSVELVDRADKLLIAHAQWLLKAEWEKVKFEARSPLYRLLHACSANCRLGDYRRWAVNKGSITSLIADFAAEKAKPIGEPPAAKSSAMDSG
jgi:hypothetical protein